MSNEKEVEAIIGYKFVNRELLRCALTHSSYAYSKTTSTVGNYQRLEFLGDALLDFVVAEELFKKYPDYDEGILTKMRAATVSKVPLAKVVASAGLTQYMYFDSNSANDLSEKVRSDIFESLLAAVYLDSNSIEIARDYVLKFLGKSLGAAKITDNIDYKSKLLEYCASKRMEWRFEFDRQEGEPHDLVFYYQLYIDDKLISTGSGKTKSAAQRICACDAGKVLGIF